MKMEVSRILVKNMERSQDYRKKHKAIRNAMPVEEVRQKSLRICEYLKHSAWYEKADVIFSYYPLGNEVSAQEFHEKIWSDGKKLALPRVEGEEMTFYVVSCMEELTEGSFHIMEPVLQCEKAVVEREHPPIVLVPGLVFDASGNRYGYGKGYYDRFFAKHPEIEMRYGLAFAHQLEREIPAKETDVPMLGIYTEDGFQRVRGLSE